MAGDIKADGVELSGPMQGLSTNPVIADVKLEAGQTVKLEVDPNNPALVVVYSGTATEIGNHQMGVFALGGALEATASAEGAEFLVLSGNPIDEPVVQCGPFVRNSQEEIVQAMRDFQNREFLQSLAS
jgi:redox-sensitive bicupin YhaK (pirin superfamily)